MNNILYDLNKYNNTYSAYSQQKLSSSGNHTSFYNDFTQDFAIDKNTQCESSIELVAQWFLHKSSMSNKKLQKLCYYAYSWFIVFFNDVENITLDASSHINVLCSEKFQAWIHGPVLPSLYRKYKKFGWNDIPEVKNIPAISTEYEDLLEQVWETYGIFSADDLESLTHKETPWINARKGIKQGEACCNEISPYDILVYYSNLG